MTDTVEIRGTILAETPDAYLLDDGDIEVWIPKSQIDNLDDDWEIEDTIEMEIPEWLAEQKGLI